VICESIAWPSRFVSQSVELTHSDWVSPLSDLLYYLIIIASIGETQFGNPARLLPVDCAVYCGLILVVEIVMIDHLAKVATSTVVAAE
jgi:hypothetical protein